MKRFIIAIVLGISLFDCLAQINYSQAVLLTAVTNEAPPGITLKWLPSLQATSFKVYKKSESSVSWGVAIATLPGTDTSYTDNNVVIDTAYEYRVVKHTPSFTAYGYIYAGIKYHPPDYKGKLIMLVDSFFVDSLAPEITRLVKDISGDGWIVEKYNVSRFDQVTYIKSIITNAYYSDPGNVKALLLLGHIPVPYSGNINPDGHPDHTGAWPADVYYADIDGVFTDFSVFNDTASHPANINVPGDGKFDQSEIPSDIELQIGRIDLSNLPAFPNTESELLKKYLDKNHNFRNKLMTCQLRSLIDDNMSSASLPVGSSGWRNFAPLVGFDAIDTTDFFTTLAHESYMWSYGLGGGTFENAAGIGHTSDFASDTVQSVFVMLFGSYFGDWDNEDNFLRAPLASANRALTCCWVGCPYWLFHHMALGENIGYSVRLTQNNSNLYASNTAARQVHIALMGDPTLKMHIVAPPSNVNLSIINDDHVRVMWSASPEAVSGYYIYRSSEEYGKYVRISPAIISIYTFTDTQPLEGINYYMVKAVKLENTPSGSYFNVSRGVYDSITYTPISVETVDNEKSQLFTYPNPVTAIVNLRFLHFKSNRCNITINDPAGHKILEREITLNAGDANCSIDVNYLTAGIYILIARTESEIIVKRMEVQK
jgi:hypothetical protein